MTRISILLIFALLLILVAGEEESVSGGDVEVSRLIRSPERKKNQPQRNKKKKKTSRSKKKTRGQEKKRTGKKKTGKGKKKSTNEIRRRNEEAGRGPGMEEVGSVGDSQEQMTALVSPILEQSMTTSPPRSPTSRSRRRTWTGLRTS